ncbi:MAG: PatB family C-S lyase [Myxococcota bacterium]|nr:PatB family C-S lyase [Myxococcota bacterium]
MSEVKVHWAGEQDGLRLEVRHLAEGPRLDWVDGTARGGADASGQPAWLDGVERALAKCRTQHPRASTDLLREAELALRNPPVDLDGLDLEQLRHRNSEKWGTYPGDDLIACWVAEMDYPLARPIHTSLARAVATDDVGYTIALPDTGLADAFAERMQARFDWSVAPGRCEILSEVVQGLYVALEAYSQPGEGAIVQTPIYPPFLGAVRETNRRLIENRLVFAAQRYEIDFDALQRDPGDDTRLLLLCNPHNPTSRVFGRDELEQLGTLALERDLVVVADEIHADLVFDGREFIPFASLSPEVAERTVTLTSASKAFNIPGLRTAIAHFGSAQLQKRFNDCIPRHARGGIGLLGIYASIAAWRHSQPWLDQVREHLQANRDFATAFLRERCPEIRFAPLESTYLMWLDCSALGLPQSPARFFFERARIALSDGGLFGPGHDEFARLNIATSRPILREILERLAGALERR